MPKDIFTKNTMADRVIFLRESKKMKPVDLARATGLSQPTIWALENGVTKPDKVRAETLLKLAAALDSTPDYIREGRGDPHKPAPGDVKELLEIYNSIPDHLRQALIAAARALKMP
jgi:transcriptional regulator with XRE-family HTH domain